MTLWNDDSAKDVLVHLGSGLGNMIMATPMIRMLAQGGYRVDLCLQGETAHSETLFVDWPYVRQVSTATEPFIQRRYGYYIFGDEVKGGRIKFRDHEKAAFLHPMWDWSRGFDLYSEIEMYTNIAKAIDPSLDEFRRTGCATSGRCFENIGPRTCVLLPGGQFQMPIRKWQGYAALAERLDDVAVVGLQSDLNVSNRVVFPAWISRAAGKRLEYQGRAWRIARRFAESHEFQLDFPPHTKNFLGGLSLADSAALIAQAGVVVGNDCGMTHVAIALGKPTIVIVGPTSTRKVFPDFLDNVAVVSNSYSCQPCQENPRLGVWRESMSRIYCPNSLQCMTSVTVEQVMNEIGRLFKERA